MKSLSWDGVVDEDRAGIYIRAYHEVHPAAALQDAFFGIANGLWLDDAAILAERKAAQRKAPVYMYLFTWESAALS